MLSFTIRVADHVRRYIIDVKGNNVSEHIGAVSVQKEQTSVK
jgi:hypothetical protein